VKAELENVDDYQKSNCRSTEEDETNALISLFVLTTVFKS
jgi:hypothetical protein